MKETLKNLKRTYSFGKQYKKNLIIFTIVSIIGIFFSVLGPYLGAKAIISLTNSKFDELILVGIVILILDIFGAIRLVIIKRNTQEFFRGTTKNIQMNLAKEVLKIRQYDMDNTSSGTFIQRMGRDSDELGRVFTIGMGNLTGILTDIGVYVTIFVMNKTIFCYYLLSMFILTLISMIKHNKVSKKDKIVRKQMEKTSSLVSELVRGNRDIKMLNAKTSFMKEMSKNIDDLTKSQFSMRNTDTNYTSFSEIIYGIINFLLILLIVFLIENKEITVAMAIVLFNYRNRALSNLVSIINNFIEQLKSFNLSANRVFTILDDKEFIKESFGNKHLDKVKGDFEFKDVSFSYGKNKVLNKLNLKVENNTTVGFVGKSGAGKTTIFNLLCKLYDDYEGTITIDGIDIRELDEDSIRGNITIINQNPYIFNMSIKDNLRLVKNNLTDKEMKEACKMACLDEFINTLPDKYDTVVGEGGVTLSGGQRQRLAIARAFLQKTEIILFDEATSALDNETQKYIQLAIDNMKKEYTILIIAHRLSTIINSDKILFLEDGKIKAEGSHEELLKKNKNYKKLYETEFSKE